MRWIMNPSGLFSAIRIRSATVHGDHYCAPFAHGTQRLSTCCDGRGIGEVKTGVRGSIESVLNPLLRYKSERFRAVNCQRILQDCSVKEC